VVEVGGFLPQVEVLQEGGPAIPGPQRVVGVVDPHALVGGQVAALRVHPDWRELFLFVPGPVEGRGVGRLLGHGSPSGRTPAAPLDYPAARRLLAGYSPATARQ
jgi:hypothetical protein